MTKIEDSKTRRSAEAAVSESSFTSAGATIDPFLQASNRILAGWMAVGTELLEFSKARLDHNLEIGKALAQTASLDEAIDLQSRYARTVMQDYVSEANKIVDLGTRSLLDSVTRLRPVADQAAKHAEAAD